MARKSMNVRGVMRMERQKGLRWMREARRHYREAEENLRQVRAYIRSRDEVTAEDRALLRDARALVRDTRDRMIYMEGVVMGQASMENVVSRRMIAVEFDPFGH